MKRVISESIADCKRIGCKDHGHCDNQWRGKIGAPCVEWDSVTTTEYGKLLRPPVTSARVRQWYADGRLPGAEKRGRDILIPENCPDPRKPHGRPPKKKK